MAALEHFFTEGDNAPDREVAQADWERLAEEAVTATRSVYPRTKPEQLREDLALLMESLIAIAQGQEPPVEVGTLSLGDYAPYMSAPHRMDLMVSAMTQDGAWHCQSEVSPLLRRRTAHGREPRADHPLSGRRRWSACATPISRR